jgi:hypothetical protein
VPIFGPVRGWPGRLRDRALNAVFRRLFDKGLPALNAARESIGLDPLRSVFEQWDRMGQFYASLERGHTTASVGASAARTIMESAETRTGFDMLDSYWLKMTRAGVAADAVLQEGGVGPWVTVRRASVSC